MGQDLRWEQRFSNYRKALHKLTQAIQYINANDTGESEKNDPKYVLDEIIKEGLIQRFEYTHELGWNTMKEFAEHQGNNNVKGSRDATREGFKINLITDGHVWMDMIDSRNSTSHTYNDDTAQMIYKKIINDYYPVFKEFESTMEELRTGKQENLFSK
jgi:nucleotidyltransferase substrate binding protein (TIGR01987 family)